MDQILRLDLLGVLLLTKGFSTQEDHPVLMNVLDLLGIGSDPGQVSVNYQNTINTVRRQFDYYDAREMQVNKELDELLLGWGMHLPGHSLKTQANLSVQVCVAGNRRGPRDKTCGVYNLLNEAERRLDILERVTGPGNMALVCYQEHVFNLGYIKKILDLVDTFVTCSAGMLLGVPEYSPSSLEERTEPPEPDFSIDGMECQENSECLCGCQMQHSLDLLEGMEDFLAGKNTQAVQYLIGAAQANDIYLLRVEGNEGAVFDKIKEMGKKAWETLSTSVKALVESFEDGDDDEKLKAAEAMVENNKKAFQAMKSTPAKINSTAEGSMITLAGNIDNSDATKTIVAGLKTPNDGPKTLDGLLGVMGKAISSGGAIRVKLAEAQKALADLKTATDGANKGDEENKEVVAGNKEKVTEAITEAKEAIKAVKAELTLHNKLMNGLKKLISGISPKIFISEEVEEGKGD